MTTSVVSLLTLMVFAMKKWQIIWQPGGRSADSPDGTSSVKMWNLITRASVLECASPLALWNRTPATANRFQSHELAQLPARQTKQSQSGIRQAKLVESAGDAAAAPLIAAK